MKSLCLLLLTLIGCGVMSGRAAAADCVILLHGLARTDKSMAAMDQALTTAGFDTHNIRYPSTSATIEQLAQSAIAPALSQCENQRIHFVTHSMGGILVRQFFSQPEAPVANLGRVVMLGPPNQGSEVVDTFGELKLFTWINGPAGLQLGTAGKAVALGAVNFELGIIAGNKSFNPILSGILPGPDDGKVTVANTHVEGEKAHIVLPVTHTFMMNNVMVQQAVIAFLKHGTFTPENSSVDK